MGLAIESDVNWHDSQSGSSRVLSRPPIQLQLSKEELDSRYNIFDISGGHQSNFFTHISGNEVSANSYGTKKTTLAESVEIIANTFGLNGKQLSEVLLISSRKTYYNWIQGKAVPRENSLQRIFDLVVLSRSWNYRGLKQPDQAALIIKGYNSKSLLELLSKENLDTEAIIFAGSRIALASGASTFRDPFI